MTATPPTALPGHHANRLRPLIGAVGLVSIVVNLLMLTGPIFMLQIYDRVLGSRSGATLLALLGLAGFLYLVMGLLDYGRALVAARMGAQYHQALDGVVGRNALRMLAADPRDTLALRAQTDLSTVQQFTAVPVFVALFDLPWVPFFLLVMLVLHPWLGAFALASVLMLAALAWINMRIATGRGAAAQDSAQAAERLSAQLRCGSDALGGPAQAYVALGTLDRLRRGAVSAGLDAAGAIAGFTASGRALRLFLQSAIMGLGAFLVLKGQINPGIMVAAAIILGRALAPVDQVIGQWSTVARARAAHARLSQFMDRCAGQSATCSTLLPAPQGHLHVRNLSLSSSENNALILDDIGFELRAGQALGVIGNSGSGKSSLARALVDILPRQMGSIRLGNAPLAQYDPAALARYIGYLPQRVALLEGRLRDAIAGHDPLARDGDVIAAARMAGVHDMILGWPRGYDTEIGPGGAPLSGGQIQRVALARAVYGDPVMVVLDEPNSSLDNDGVLALNSAIRALKARGACVLVMAHRPAAIAECDLLMLLESGRIAALGPRDDVLRKVARNSAELIHTHFAPTTGSNPACAEPAPTSSPEAHSAPGLARRATHGG